MTEKAFRQLNIDPEFKNLIRPLRREEYRQLELNLVVEGCREDIIAWNDTIIDGHNRYEICNKCAFLMESRSWIFQAEMLPSPGSVRTNSDAATSQKKPGNI